MLKGLVKRFIPLVPVRLTSAAIGLNPSGKWFDIQPSLLGFRPSWPWPFFSSTFTTWWIHSSQVIIKVLFLTESDNNLDWLLIFPLSCRIYTHLATLLHLEMLQWLRAQTLAPPTPFLPWPPGHKKSRSLSGLPPL